jgi:hypothetical protein
MRQKRRQDLPVNLSSFAGVLGTGQQITFHVLLETRISTMVDRIYHATKCFPRSLCPSLYSKQSVHWIFYNYVIVVTRTTDALGTMRLLFGVYWMKFWKGGKYSPVRSHPASSSDDPQRGVSAVARLNGERPVIIQGSDDILQDSVCGAQMQNDARLIR